MLGCVGLCRAEWVFMDTNSDGDEWYVDTKVTNTGYRECSQIWVKVIYAKPQYYKKKRYDYEFFLVQFDSRCLKYATISLNYYNNNGNVVFNYDDNMAPSYVDWNNVPPETMIEEVAQIVRNVKRRGEVTYTIEWGDGSVDKYVISYQK